MVPIELLERFEQKVNELIDRRIESIADGSASDYPAYQRLTGEVHGLRLAINELRELMEGHNRQ